MLSRVALFALTAGSALVSGCIVRARPVYYRPATVVVTRPSVVVAQPVATATVVAQPVATAQPVGNVVLLGERVVNFAVDRDIVPLAARPEAFRGMFLEAVGGGIEMFDCDVIFENGQRIDLPVRQFLAPGTRTRVFDFPGIVRNIARVTLVYRTATAGTGRAVVRIWGVM
ncbi:MAG: hypothetical protein JNK05_17060 [Myxococcales bacterium]|nr:hypothetical protein [Myxococcales bacterium]